MTSRGPRSCFSAIGMAVVAVLAAGGLAGCGDDTTNNSKTDIANPNPVALSPTGILQGQITDAVTGAVIVGVVVSIGAQSATTDATGHYVINNVPANNNENLVAGLTGKYQATLDLSGVTSPVNMTDSAATPRYPTRKPSMPVSVTFSSFDESANGGGTASNHDTPVVNLVANHDFKVGKLTATLSGVAGDPARQPKGLATVELRDANGNLETSTQTDTALGTYTFANVEAGVAHSLFGRDVGTSIQGNTATFTLSDNQKLDLALGDPGALVLASYDTHAPRVMSITPENNADVPAGTVDVVLMFNEPIKQDGYSKVGTSFTPVSLGVRNIRDDIAVNYLGSKASNVAHTLSWNASNTALTVRLASVGTSSKYSVDFSATVGQIRDMADLVSVAGPVGNTVAFSTDGATTVTAPAVVAVNSASIGHGTTSVVLDWAPISGATKGYNVYRADKRSGLTGPMTLLANVLPSTYTDATPIFVTVGSDVALSYDYAVSAINADGMESALSASVLTRDVIAPSVPVVASTCVVPGGVSMLPAGGTTANGQIQITFSEPMPEVALETVANYTPTPAAPAVSAATQISATQVVLEFGAVIACAGTSTVALTGITDLAGNAYPSATLVTF